MGSTSRRHFLRSAATAGVCAAGIRGGGAGFLAATTGAAHDAAPIPASAVPAMKKGLVYTMLPGELSHADRCQMARDTGFEVVQAPTAGDEHTAEEIKIAARQSEPWDRLGHEHGSLAVSPVFE